ncbi:hypothetical protein F2P81_006934 [Scophthalmus maximus]|uniref:Uncharacterized protein n=1 Tax=Scophthalmus maximus TaxID=52904 RepID=A0A6A4T0R8_SCOMX|nr:hypothetical protein F2P81_006934 [Scophthalmus maximus]
MRIAGTEPQCRRGSCCSMVHMKSTGGAGQRPPAQLLGAGRTSPVRQAPPVTRSGRPLSNRGPTGCGVGGEELGQDSLQLDKEWSLTLKPGQCSTLLLLFHSIQLVETGRVFAAQSEITRKVDALNHECPGT